MKSIYGNIYTHHVSNILYERLEGKIQLLVHPTVLVTTGGNIP